MLEIKWRPRRPLVIPSICFVVGLLIGDRISGVYLFKEYPIIGLIPIVGFFVFRSLGKHDSYRRIYAASLIFGFYIMLINTWVMDWSVPDRNNLPKTFIGTVVRVEEIDGRTEVLIQGEYRVLINEYEVEGENPRGVTIDDLGKTVSVELKPEKPLDSGNPGCFNYRKYLYGRGIQLTASINVGDIEILEERKNPYYIFTSFVITKREEYLDSMFKEDEARSIAAGILFGRSREIPEERRNEFMEGGAGHILAVSGIHIGLLYSVYKSIERRLKIKSLILKEGILISFFVIYGTAAMWSVSVTRAMILVFLKELANLGDRRFDSTSSLILVSDLMLLLRPYLIFSSGFQMSFLAVLGICFFRPKMLYLLNRISKKEVAMTSRDETLSMLASMMSVQVLMIPYTIFVFNRFSVLSIINNWLIVIIAGFYVPFGGLGFFLSSIVGLIPGGGSRLLGAAIGRVLGYMGDSMIWINKTMLLDGNSVWSVVSPDPVLLITFLCLGTYLSSETNKIAFARDRIKAIYKVLKIIIFTVILSSFLFFNPVCLSSQVFLDVGQGDSFHIKWGETNILIDGGGSLNYNVAERALKPYLLRRGISSLDAAISTH